MFSELVLVNALTAGDKKRDVCANVSIRVIDMEINDNRGKVKDFALACPL
jgi:hypothetical protein